MITQPRLAASTFLASLLCLSAGAAFATPAGELYPATEQYQAAPVRSSAVKSRAAVENEAAQARLAGRVVDGEAGYAVAAPEVIGTALYAKNGKSRAEVVAELRQASSDGTLVKIGEVEQFPAEQLAGTPRSRAEVRAEAIESARNTTTGWNPTGR